MLKQYEGGVDMIIPETQIQNPVDGEPCDSEPMKIKRLPFHPIVDHYIWLIPSVVISAMHFWYPFANGWFADNVDDRSGILSIPLFIWAWIYSGSRLIKIKREIQSIRLPMRRIAWTTAIATGMVIYSPLVFFIGAILIRIIAPHWTD